MKTNLHKLDRILRLVFALVVGLYIYQEPEAESAFIDVIKLAAVVFGITGMINFCPIYKVFGISTVEPDNENDKG